MKRVPPSSIPRPTIDVVNKGFGLPDESTDLKPFVAFVALLVIVFLTGMYLGTKL